MPAAYEAYRDYRQEAVMLSRAELQAVKMLITGQQPDYAALGLSPREQRELVEKLELPKAK